MRYITAIVELYYTRYACYNYYIYKTFSITTIRILCLGPNHAGFLYVRPTMRAFISTPHYAGYLYLRPTTWAFYIDAPPCGLFILMPHHAGFIFAPLRGLLHLCPAMRVFYVYAPLCGFFMFMPHYAGFLYLCPTMRAFVWPLRGRTPGDNKMSALACSCEN